MNPIPRYRRRAPLTEKQKDDFFDVELFVVDAARALLDLTNEEEADRPTRHLTYISAGFAPFEITPEIDAEVHRRELLRRGAAR